MKRFLCAWMALLMVFYGLTSLAEPPEEYEIGDTVEYQGGVVRRGTTRAVMPAISWDELDVAYVKCDMPYLVEGVPATWTVTATGGKGKYEYAFILFYRRGRRGMFSCCDMQAKSASNSFTSMPYFSEGQYLLVVQLYDKSGDYLEWQGPILETSQASDEKSTGTVPGKVAELARQCLEEAGDSEINRALWLHDWLTNNAEYDETLTYYFPDGVLLHGTGICDSYALAYRMLLNAVGIENLYISGHGWDVDTQKWINHAWNLVKLGGHWYHVDCTWDDPTGGKENHTYFALSDQEIMDDHEWDNNNGLMPRCTSFQIDFSSLVYKTNTETVEEGLAKLENAVKRGDTSLYLVFPDEKTASEFSDLSMQYLGRAMFDGLLVAARRETGWELEIRNHQVTRDFLMPDESSLRVCDLFFNYGGGFRETDEVRYATFIEDEIQVAPGKSACPSLYCVPYGGTGVKWSSSNSRVATVNNGKVTGCAAGTAVITATLPGGAAVSCTVRVVSGSRCVVTGNVKVIADEAFEGCAGIETLVVEDGVTAIGARAFADCAGLITAQLPASVTYIAADAFEGVDGFEIVAPEGSAAAWFAAAYGIPCTTP